MSGLLNVDDLAQMCDDLAALIADRQEEIVIRRGDDTLPAQSVRITGDGGGGEAEGDGTQQAEGGALVFGSADLDVQPGDRFNDAWGRLYRVVFVQPNQRTGVVAEAEVIE